MLVLRNRWAAGCFLAATTAAVIGYSPSTLAFSPPMAPTLVGSSRRQRLPRAPLSAVDGKDCGCGEGPPSTVFGGEPPAAASSSLLDARQAVRSHPLYDVRGRPTSLDDELVLQWSQRTDELQASGVRLALVSVGKPEVANQLLEHLEVAPQLRDKFLVDPDNLLYNALQLNRGIQRTFFNVNTPFAFLDRFTRRDGTQELQQVLSKWNRAFYIPPKPEQAFLQGGTFVFRGPQTLYAHYDPSTAAHAPFEDVLNAARTGGVEAAIASVEKPGATLPL